MNSTFTNTGEEKLTLAKVRELYKQISSIQEEHVLDKILHNGCKQFFDDHFALKPPSVQSNVSFGFPIFESDLIPEGEIHMVDSRGRVLKIIRYLKK